MSSASAPDRASSHPLEPVLLNVIAALEGVRAPTPALRLEIVHGERVVARIRARGERWGYELLDEDAEARQAREARHDLRAAEDRTSVARDAYFSAKPEGLAAARDEYDAAVDAESLAERRVEEARVASRRIRRD